MVRVQCQLAITRLYYYNITILLLSSSAPKNITLLYPFNITIITHIIFTRPYALRGQVNIIVLRDVQLTIPPSTNSELHKSTSIPRVYFRSSSLYTYRRYHFTSQEIAAQSFPKLLPTRVKNLFRHFYIISRNVSFYNYCDIVMQTRNIRYNILIIIKM